MVAANEAVKSQRRSNSCSGAAAPVLIDDRREDRIVWLVALPCHWCTGSVEHLKIEQRSLRPLFLFVEMIAMPNNITWIESEGKSDAKQVALIEKRSSSQSTNSQKPY